MPNMTIANRRRDLLSALASLDDGTGNLGVIVDHALADNPDVAVDEIRDIVLDAKFMTADSCYRASAAEASAREGDEGEHFDPAPEPPRYERIALSELPDGVRFDVPRRFQGQGTAGEVAYGGFGRSEHDHGDPYKRVRTAVEVGRSRGGTYYKLVR